MSVAALFGPIVRRPNLMIAPILEYCSPQQNQASANLPYRSSFILLVISVSFATSVLLLTARKGGRVALFIHKVLHLCSRNGVRTVRMGSEFQFAQTCHRCNLAPCVTPYKYHTPGSHSFSPHVYPIRLSTLKYHLQVYRVYCARICNCRSLCNVDETLKLPPLDLSNPS
jgi:hypothetical protein